MSFRIDRHEEVAMIDAYTPEKVRRVMVEAAHAGGMGPPSLGPGDRRIPWPERLVRLSTVIQDYVERNA